MRSRSRSCRWCHLALALAAIFPSVGSASTWNINGDGSWSVPGNWSGGVPNGPGQFALFANVITAPHNVKVDGDFTVSTLSFSTPSATRAYTLADAGGLITLSPAGFITSTSGNVGGHTLAASLSFAGPVTIANNSSGNAGSLHR